MNREYERFLTNTNGIDGQLAHLPADQLLNACIRHSINSDGAPKTAGSLYRIADIVAVSGIIDPNPVKPNDGLEKKTDKLIKTLKANIALQKNKHRSMKIRWLCAGIATGFILDSIIMVNL